MTTPFPVNRQGVKSPRRLFSRPQGNLQREERVSHDMPLSLPRTSAGLVGRRSEGILQLGYLLTHSLYRDLLSRSLGFKFKNSLVMVLDHITHGNIQIEVQRQLLQDSSDLFHITEQRPRTYDPSRNERPCPAPDQGKHRSHGNHDIPC